MTQVRPKWATPLAQLLIAAGATAALGHPLRKALLSRGTLDIPNHRSSHTTPVPRGGGIATVLGATTAALICRANPGLRTTAGVIGLAALGLADDISGHIPARVRLAGQLVAGATNFTNSPMDTFVAAPVTAGVVNVVNFMDGINGISGMTAVVWGVNAMLMDAESGGRLATLGALTAGAGLGFLPHNIPNARLFLGDVGSYAFGAAVAAGILDQSNLRNRYLVGAPLVLYAADAAQALIRRAGAGQPLTEAHREHVYQQLVHEVGLSHVVVSTVHALFATAICFASHMPMPANVITSAAITTCYISLARAHPLTRSR